MTSYQKTYSTGDANELREGFTTGSCATAAAKASAVFLSTGEVVRWVEIELPNGQLAQFEVQGVEDSRDADATNSRTFGVIKDAGSDPDITDGLMVCSRVDRRDASTTGITFVAGDGVGTATLPGLKVAPGEAAINPVPREMISTAVYSVLEKGMPLTVEVSVPGGIEIAKRTFNPRLGVVGGISIIGTSGIVRPMSKEALTDALASDLDVKAASTRKALALCFGASGEKAFEAAYEIPRDAIVQMSNFVGYVVDGCATRGFRKLLIGGHPGKLVKVAAGIMNTHNMESDGRQEILCAHAALMGASKKTIVSLWEATTTEAAISILDEAGLQSIWNILAESVKTVVERRVRKQSGKDLEIEAVFFAQDGHVLGLSDKAELLAEEVCIWES